MGVVLGLGSLAWVVLRSTAASALVQVPANFCDPVCHTALQCYSLCSPHSRRCLSFESQRVWSKRRNLAGDVTYFLYAKVDLCLSTMSKPWMLAGLELCFAYAYAVASLERGNGEALLFT